MTEQTVDLIAEARAQAEKTQADFQQLQQEAQQQAQQQAAMFAETYDEMTKALGEATMLNRVLGKQVQNLTAQLQQLQQAQEAPEGAGWPEETTVPTDPAPVSGNPEAVEGSSAAPEKKGQSE